MIDNNYIDSNKTEIDENPSQSQEIFYQAFSKCCDKRDYATAIAVCELAVSRGDENAYHDLASLFGSTTDNGYKNPMANREKFIEFHTKCANGAKSNYITHGTDYYPPCESAKKLAILYCMEKNFLLAKIWYERARELKDVEATYSLGLLYEMGAFGSYDYLEAARLYMEVNVIPDCAGSTFGFSEDYCPVEYGNGWVDADRLAYFANKVDDTDLLEKIIQKPLNELIEKTSFGWISKEKLSAIFEDGDDDSANDSEFIVEILNSSSLLFK